MRQRRHQTVTSGDTTDAELVSLVAVLVPEHYHHDKERFFSHLTDDLRWIGAGRDVFRSKEELREAAGTIDDEAMMPSFSVSDGVSAGDGPNHDGREEISNSRLHLTAASL
ncbi:hypothetical protein ACTND8_08450 [Atopobiaceae bacterium HCP3S3_F7]